MKSVLDEPGGTQPQDVVAGTLAGTHAVAGPRKSPETVEETKETPQAVEEPTAPAEEPDEAAEASESEGEDEADVDFASVYADWEESQPTLKPGAVVTGRIMKILEKEVIVDIGYKSEGIINLDEFRNMQGEHEAKIGDEVDVLLEKTEDAQGYVVLSKEKAERLKIWDVVEQAFESGEPILGRVVDRIKGGLKVDIGLPAFLPGSLVDVRPVRNLESLRGLEFRMRVIKVNKRRGNIVLSRKAILEEENAEKKTKTLEDLEEGKIIRGVVKNLTEYGAFIDLGGIDGLLHITDMSWGRINHPSEKFQIGDEVDVIVLKFDRDRERVSLGFKQLQEDPWEGAIEKYPAETRVRGKVVSLTDYGAFIEVEEGVEGLVHVSEMSWTKRVKHPSKILNVGDWVESVVLEIDQESRRLSLGIKQTEANPWDMINTKYRVGDVLTGTIRNITDFGVFIEVEEGIDGLVHISDISWNTRVSHPSEVLNKGDEVKAVILKIDSENQRLSLGLKQLQPNALEDFFSSNNVGTILPGKIVRLTEFGAFVELFDGVEGLVHVSEMSKDRIEKPEDAFEVDQKVMVKVIKLDAVERKIGLSIKEAENADAYQAYSAESGASSSSGAGAGATLGDLKSAEILSTLKMGGSTDEPEESEESDETPAVESAETESADPEEPASETEENKDEDK